MKINSLPVKFIIFSGGGLLERVQKVHLTPEFNEFEIENVPASFDHDILLISFYTV
ncbi:MAG: hypothetical protein ACTSX4_12715 [Candidatus Helarchaeota archaeon]